MLTDQFVQLGAVCGRTEFIESNPAAIENRPHLMEVIEFFLDDFGHRPGEVGVLDIGEEQIHGDTRGFLLAMRVIDKEQVDMVFDLLQPAGGGRSVKVEHA